MSLGSWRFYQCGRRGRRQGQAAWCHEPSTGRAGRHARPWSQQGHRGAPLPSHSPLRAGSRGSLYPEGLRQPPAPLAAPSAAPPSGTGPAEGRNVCARLRARAGRRKNGAMHRAEVSRAAAGAADGSGGMQGAGGRPAAGGSARALWAGLCPQAPGSARAPRPADWRWAAPGRGSPGGRAAMATRRLTDAFLLLRNNAVQSRQLLAEQVSSYGSSSPLNSRSMAAAVSLLPSSYVPCCAEGCPRPRRARCSAPPPPAFPARRANRRAPCRSLRVPPRALRPKRRWPSREVIAHWFLYASPVTKTKLTPWSGTLLFASVWAPLNAVLWVIRCVRSVSSHPTPFPSMRGKLWGRVCGGQEVPVWCLQKAIALWPFLWLFVCFELVALRWET